ncbi:MAG: hypothetical protein LQ350_003959 [Teloschistes chrysophthalmus]|nr:MAG: hypothetical protein LQ350_003959 [Niorma chrysophthalma]
MDNHQAQDYLGTLLGKQLRIHITDGRVFVGEFKCTDNALDRSALLRSAPDLLYQLKKAVYNPPSIANSASLKLAEIPFNLPPLLETADPPLFQPHIPNRDFLAKIQSANKWAFAEATFSSFLYILFEPP